jgi:D-alanyl-D-alanine carboxypeptidase
MTRSVLAAVVVLLLATTAQAQTLASRLAAIADAAVAEEDIAGIVLGVAYSGEAPVVRAAGQADLARHRPMAPDAGFKVASIGKTFIAALTLQLAEDGKLAVDDKLGRFLPSVPNAMRVSLRDLLGHRSGYDDYITDAFVRAAHAHPDKIWTARELLAFAGPQRLRFTPGSRYDYSNTNYLLLGMALEAATGEPLAKLIRDRLLEPLGLHHTWLATTETVPPGALARGYAILDNNGSRHDATDEAWALGGADGAMVSDAADLLTWAQALFGGGVLPPKRLAQMLDFARPPEANGDFGSGYGLGVERIPIAGVTFYGHTGSAPGYNSMLLYEPMTRTAIVAAINQDPPDEALLDILTERMVHMLEDSGLRHFPHGPDGEAQSTAKE